MPARSTGIARLAATTGRLVGDAVDGYGRWVEIKCSVATGSARQNQDASPHQRSGCSAIEADDIGELAAFIVEEEIGLAAPELGCQGPADGYAVTVSMRSRERCGLAVDQGVIVPPKIGGAHIASVIELVERAVKRVRAALGDHLYLAASGGVEVGRLAGGANFEFFYAFDWSWDDAGRGAARRSAA